MAISAYNPTGTLKQCVRTPRLAVIEFVLDSLPHLGTAGEVLHLTLAPNYVVAPSRLHHELIFFEVGDANLDEHTSRISEITKGLQEG